MYLKKLLESERAWQLLSGITCVYKPPEVSAGYVKHRIRENLCKDLNKMETRPVKQYLEVKVNGNEVTTNFRPSYADNVLCVGPRYQWRDIDVDIPFNLGSFSSGVLLVAINSSVELREILKMTSFSRCFRLKGILGQATSSYDINGKVLGRAKYDQVDFDRFQKILSFHQSFAQRRAFEEYGFDLTSEKAYNFAIKGLYRPNKGGATIIYNLKLVELKPPDFEIEIQCVNDTELFLKNLIHELGMKLKCYATCTGMRCIRHGYFNIEHALLRKYWKVDDIIDNIKVCTQVLKNDYRSYSKFSLTESAT